MGIKSDIDNKGCSNYSFHRKAGRSIIECSPVFSPDGESVVLIVQNIVRVYNIQTGDCARTLETESGVNELVAIHFPENENYNLYGCSDKGCITIWTWEKGAVLREMYLQIPNDMRILTFNLIDSNECFITAIGPSQNHIYLATYSIKTGGLLHEYKDTQPQYFDIVRVSLGWCNGDRYVALVNGTKSLYIQNLNQPHLKSEVINHNYFRIMAVSAHHNENAVAITDTLGRTTIIRGNLYNYRNIAREVLHWHCLPPLAICFSVQGNYLYTGGMEKVLVKWTVGHLANKANEKLFIPRLPGMIRYITTNSTHIAVTLSNNSVVIANAQMRVVSTILECGGLSPSVRAIGTALVYHRPLGALLMGGRTGHLQLYSTTTDKVLYNIDITEMNNIPPERHNLLPLDTEVTCAAISGNGSWLVTSEYRNDGVIYPEERLKFWSIQTRSNTPFRLNTCVNLSHGGCNVVSLAIDNKGDFCVSAGTDHKFRIWKKVFSTQPQRNKVSWSCLTACYYSSGISQFVAHGFLNEYKNSKTLVVGKPEDFEYMKEINPENDVVKKIFNIHKENSLFDTTKSINSGIKKSDDLDMGGVAISQDGSLIAAWFGCKLTLWDTHLCNLRTTLSHPALRPKGVDVKFGNNDAAHYLVSTAENCVAVWSLLSLTLKWLVQINPTCLAADPFSNKMAVVTKNNDLFVFTPHKSTPIFTRKRLLDPETGLFKQCTFGASSGDDIRLYVMRNDTEIYCLEPEQSDEGHLEVVSRRNLPASNFSALLAEQQLSEVRPVAAGALHALDSRALNNATAQFLSAAPHMVPSVSLLSTSFLEIISGQEESNEGQERTEEKEDKMEVQSDSSDDEDRNVSTHSGSFAPKTTELWTPNYEQVKEKRLKKIQKEPFLDLEATAMIFGV